MLASRMLSPLQQSQIWLAEIIKPGDYVVDATLGNGHDTLFLLNCLKNNNADIQGFLWGFDVQEQALNNTRLRLTESGIKESAYKLNLCSHAELGSKVNSSEVAVIMFNLGYLPGADKQMITKTDQTMIALKAAVIKLRLGGVLSVMCYPGHLGGDEESLAVESWVSELDKSSFSIKKVEAQYVSSTSAFLLWIQKIS